jgi:hypothetical protein
LARVLAATSFEEGSQVLLPGTEPVSGADDVGPLASSFGKGESMASEMTGENLSAEDPAPSPMANAWKAALAYQLGHQRGRADGGLGLGEPEKTEASALARASSFALRAALGAEIAALVEEAYDAAYQAGAKVGREDFARKSPHLTQSSAEAGFSGDDFSSAFSSLLRGPSAEAGNASGTRQRETYGESKTVRVVSVFVSSKTKSKAMGHPRARPATPSSAGPMVRRGRRSRPRGACLPERPTTKR